MNKRTRILYLLYEPFTSGQAAHVLSLVRGLDPAEFELRVILPDLLASSAPAFEAAEASVSLLPIRRLLWKPTAVFGMVREIRAWQPDIIHIHSQEAGLVARPIAWLAGARRIFYTPQTIDIRRKRWQKWVDRAEALLAHVTRCIFSVNEADRQRLLRLGIPADKVMLLYNGVDLDAVTADPPPRDALPGEGPLVLQLGRLSEQKNPLAFVEGAALVLREVPQARFVMIGSGPLELSVRQRVVELGLTGKIALLGSVPQASRLLGLADVVTLTSLWEGTPYSLIEAAAWGKPLVATAVNGCPEVIADGLTGYVVPPGDVAAWAERVARLLLDRELAERLGHAGHERAERLFRVQDMVERLAELYRQGG